MIDIIIPIYNGHDTIKRCLDSIKMQINMPVFKVTLVNDFDGTSYSDDIDSYHSYFDIVEINTNKNVGPGQAREYGICHTNYPYIIFIDCDDYFYDEYSVSKLFEHKFYDLVVSYFEYHRDDEVIIKKNNLVWLHGKMYKREYLEKENIHFNDTRANEDNGFNRLIYLGPSNIKYIFDLTYVYYDNKNSITRKKNREYKFSGLEWYSYNINWACEEAFNRGYDINKIQESLLGFLVSMYYYYFELKDDFEVDKIIEWCINPYKLFEKVKSDDSSMLYDIFINSKKYDEHYRKLKIVFEFSFQEFLDKIKKISYLL